MKIAVAGAQNTAEALVAWPVVRPTWYSQALPLPSYGLACACQGRMRPGRSLSSVQWIQRKELGQQSRLFAKVAPALSAARLSGGCLLDRNPVHHVTFSSPLEE
jgi:hypothetical protein